MGQQTYKIALVEINTLITTYNFIFFYLNIQRISFLCNYHYKTDISKTIIGIQFLVAFNVDNYTFYMSIVDCYLD